MTGYPGGADSSGNDPSGTDSTGANLGGTQPGGTQPGGTQPSASADGAADLTRLDQEVAALQARAMAAYKAWVAADSALRVAAQQRDALAARVQAMAATPAGPQPAPGAPLSVEPGAPPSVEPGIPRPGETGAPGPVRETSTRTVQNVLFVLGGLLLGTAAVAFTAVAWATFGVGGRAAILGVVTLIALSLPLLALSRGLRATAETFVALGLLLVVLDGYAAWYVNLGQVQSIPGARYAGLVLAATAGVALGYRMLTGLVGPAFAALIAIQPVILLVVGPAHPGAAGVSFAATGTAALNMVIAWRQRGATERAGRRRMPTSVAVVFSVLTLVLCGVWIVVGALTAFLAEGIGSSVADRAVAGAATVTVGLVLLAVSMLSARPGPRRAAAGVLVILVAIAVVPVAATAWPGHLLLLAAAVSAALGAAVLVVWQILPAEIRWGPRVGALTVAGSTVVVAAALSLSAAATTVARSFPIWAATLDATGPNPPLATWDLPVAILVLLLAFLLNTPQWSRTPVVVGCAVLVVLALPACVALVWWAPAATSLGAAALLAGLALAGRSPGATLTLALGSAALAGDAVLTCLARPTLTAAVLGAGAVLGLVVGLAAARPEHPRAERVIVGAVAVLAGLMAVPATVGSALVAARVLPWWTARATVAATGLLLLAIVALRGVRRRGEHDGFARALLVGPAFVATLLSAVLWPAVALINEPPGAGIYGGVSLLLVALAMLAMPHEASATGPGRSVVVGGLLAGVPGALTLATAVAPSVVAVAFAPYAWLSAVWTGRPPGVGLAPNGDPLWPVPGTDAIALGLLAVATATAMFAATRRPGRALAGLGVGGPTAILVALTAARAPWPALPAATLLLGVLLVMAVALIKTAPGRTRFATGRDIIYAGQGVVYIGSAIAGCLAVEWATLAAVGVLVVAGAVVGAVGRDRAWRVAGFLTGVAAALGEAAAAGLAADVRVRDTAFAVLAVAAAALFVGALLPAGRRAESVATQAAAHAGAVVALLFTIGWRDHAAGVCAVWGIAVAVRALLPATSRPGRVALAAVAAGAELLAWWLVLLNRGVTVIEAYTLPLAAVALLAGWAALRSRPDLRSWVAYGPALAAAFAPSLAAVIATTGEPWRRLALGAGALAVVVAGAMSRRRAPVVIGGIVLILVALHELVLLWQLLPGWVPLAVGGVILVGLAITYERRLRDLSRLRSALRRMT